MSHLYNEGYNTRARSYTINCKYHNYEETNNLYVNYVLIYILRVLWKDMLYQIILFQVHKRQHWSKRVIKRFKDSQYENSTILNKEQTTSKNESLDADLCKEALVTLQNILHSGTISLKRVFHMVHLFTYIFC